MNRLLRQVLCLLMFVMLWPREASAQSSCYVYDRAGQLTQSFSVDLRIDPQNCGTCGNVCGPQAPLCSSGACKACDPRTDTDCDGIPNVMDNCPRDQNPGQQDTDVGGPDGVGDACDNCPLVKNADQINTDHAKDGGDACDPDDDNDLCLDATDDNRTSDSRVVGWRITAFCADSTRNVYGWAGADSDSDGVLDCDVNEADDDNDGVLDADDRCPVNPGTDDLLCQSAAISCAVTIPWNICLLGGCNQFLIRVVSVINPAIFIREFHLDEQSSLILYPSAQQPLARVEHALRGRSFAAQSQAVALAGRRDRVRIELWSKTRRGTPGQRLGTLIEYDPQSLRMLDAAGDGALVLSRADGTAPVLQRREPSGRQRR